MKASLDKNSIYRTTILSAIKKDLTHPNNLDIDMQAHHIISAKGLTDCGKALGLKIEKLGYNVNVLKNLVLIPCTLEGACHLGVQLHRGNHTFLDDDHPRSYHNEVAYRLSSLEEELDKKCKNNKSILGLLNKESVKILDLIDDFKLPLTRIYKSFKKTGMYSKVGCSDATTVGKHSYKKECSKGRLHFPNVTTNYTLKVGQ